MVYAVPINEFPYRSCIENLCRAAHNRKLASVMQGGSGSQFETYAKELQQHAQQFYGLAKWGEAALEALAAEGDLEGISAFQGKTGKNVQALIRTLNEIKLPLYDDGTSRHPSDR